MKPLPFDKIIKIFFLSLAPKMVLMLSLAPYTLFSQMPEPFYTSAPSLNGIELLVENNSPTNTFKLNDSVGLKVVIKNTNSTSLPSSSITYCIQSFTGQPIKEGQVQIDTIAALTQFQYILNLKVDSIGFYIADISFKSTNNTDLTVTHGFAIEPLKVISPHPKPHDFKVFWVKTLAKLYNTPTSYVMIPDASLSNEVVDVYSVEMYSLDSTRIQGWYVAPKGKTGLPAVVYTQGYSTDNYPSSRYLRYTEYAQFFLNIRGHGSSIKDVNPGFPAYLTHGLNSKYTYIFRGAYMDCIRSLDFLCSRPELDCNRLGIWGTSMGGALALATAALDRRTKACVFDLPFLSDFRTYFDISDWPSYQFRYYAGQNSKSMTEIHSTLDYFDIKNLAPWVQCPTMMGVGLLDMTCPPAINFAAYNNLRVHEKYFYLYPQIGHTINGEHFERMRQFFLTRL